MGFEQFDIWNRARDLMLVYVDTSGVRPEIVFDGYMHVIDIDPGTGAVCESATEKVYKLHFPIRKGGVGIQKDPLFNIMYGAAFQFRCGIKAFFEDSETTVEYEELIEHGETIDQFATMIPYACGATDFRAFFKEFKQQTVFCSTPFGDDSDGNPQVYLLNTDKDEYDYQPVFLSMEHMEEYFANIGRGGHLIMHDTFKGFTKTLRQTFKRSPIPMPGIVIEPAYQIATRVSPGEL